MQAHQVNTVCDTNNFFVMRLGVSHRDHVITLHVSYHTKS